MLGGTVAVFISGELVAGLIMLGVCALMGLFIWWALRYLT
jgi:hypothetical protein